MNAVSPSQPTSSSPTDNPSGLALEVVPGTFAICRLKPGRVPRWAFRGDFISITRSPEELSIVCAETGLPARVQAERGWRAIRVVGPLDFSLIGVLASVARPLAADDVGLLSISTYDTDYFLIRDGDLERAIAALEAAGHRFDVPPEELPRPPAQDPAGAKAPVDEKPAAERGPAPPGDEKPAGDERPQAGVKPAADERPPADAETRSERTGRRGGRRRQRPEPRRDERADETRDDKRRDETGVTTGKTRAGGRSGRRRRQPTALADERAGGVPEPRSAEPRAAEPRSTEPRAAEPQSPKPRPAEPRPTAPEPAARETRRRRPDRDDDTAKESTLETAADVATPDAGPADVATPDEPSGPQAPGDREALPPPPSDAIDEHGDLDTAGIYTGAIPQHPVETTDQAFDQLGLSPEILDTVRGLGFEHPTPIQAAVIPVALEGRDLIGLAETGSGKTAAFALPLAERLTHGRGIRGLILCPTREIALQTKAFLDIFGREHELDTVCVIGGVRIGPQMDHLRQTPDIIVATPGRLVDHLGRRTVRLDAIEALVLDEADHMLDLGFLPQIQTILQAVPEKRHTMMFSATMPLPIKRLAGRFMEEPEMIDFRPVGRAASGIEHRLYMVREGDRTACLIGLLDELSGSTLVFARRKIEAEALARHLRRAGYRAERLHSDRSQAQRVRALKAFREGEIRTLVATDVAARGIDVPRIEHVINYELPEMVEDYVHRAGRTARGVAGGVVSSIATWKNKVTIREIEKALGLELPRKTVPGVDPYVELKPRKTIRRRLL